MMSKPLRFVVGLVALGCLVASREHGVLPLLCGIGLTIGIILDRRAASERKTP